MMFDGAFHVPSWLRQLSVHPIDLIVHCRREEGGQFGPPSDAAMALAGWLLADVVRAEREAKRAGSPLSMGGVITRLLAGSQLPSEQLAESIGRMTGGDITFDMFERAAAGVPDDGALAALPVPETEAPLRPVLGETASGPLWKARRGARQVEVDGGFGIRMNMSFAAAALLRDQLNRALEPQL